MPTTNISEMITKPTLCPACGKKFDYAFCPEIIIPGGNKIKRKVLNRTMFFPKCPYCGEEFKIKPQCMYRDDNRREWFIVTDQPGDEIEKMLEIGDIHVNGIDANEDMVDFMKGLYKRRVVHDVDAFREKILLSDSNYDDRIIELMKFSLSGVLEKENHTRVYRIFLEETSGNLLVFTAIMGSRPPFEYVSVKTPTKVYYDFKNKYLDKLDRPEANEYISTDQKWAANSGLLAGTDPGFVIPI